MLSCDGTPHIACHECKVLHCTLHVFVLCQSEICVGLRQWAANLRTLLLLLLLVLVTPVPVCGYVASGMRCLLNAPKMLMVK